MFILNHIKSFLAVTLCLLFIGYIILVSQKGSIAFGTDDLAFKVGGEGPHVFIEDNRLAAMYVKGSRSEGFYPEALPLEFNQAMELPVYFAKDDSSFHVALNLNEQSPFAIPASTYEDQQPILAISDLEGNFETFKNFLITHEIMNEELVWTFNQGHLVLVGDMVDRGHSTTQLLWLIYHLEQQAKTAGGVVHFIIGNHEIKNLQGNFKSASHKYLPIAGILGKQQYDLFSDEALLGRWLASKNVIEKINGYVFTHGGLHPDIQNLGMTLDEINQLVRAHYRDYYYPSNQHSEAQKLLLSTNTGPAWYRGYFKGELSQQQVESSLAHFNAKAAVVGHTLQFNVNEQYEGRVIAIDVKHPDDYSTSLPIKRSEGLLLTTDARYRLVDDGAQELL